MASNLIYNEASVHIIRDCYLLAIVVFVRIIVVTINEILRSIFITSTFRLTNRGPCQVEILLNRSKQV